MATHPPTRAPQHVGWGRQRGEGNAPRLVLSTSYMPLAALMFMCSAAPFPIVSALGFTVFTADMVALVSRSRRKHSRGVNIGVHFRAPFPAHRALQGQHCCVVSEQREVGWGAELVVEERWWRSE